MTAHIIIEDDDDRPEQMVRDPDHYFAEARQRAMRELVRSALLKHAGNKSRAAQELGISRCYLHRLLNQLTLGDGCGPYESEETADEESADADTPKLVSERRRVNPALRIA